jgi:hypothetical protein
MTGSTRLDSVVAGIFLTVLAATACADGAAQNLALPSGNSTFHTKSYVLAANDQTVVTTPAQANASAESDGAAASAPNGVRDPWFSANKIHEYLGLGTLALVIATTATAPENEGNNSSTSNQTTGTHQTLGRATRAMALTTVATGLLFHWDDMHLFEDGFKDPDTQHWLLGGAGALILANAVSRAPARSHAAQAELGAAMMLAAIKLTW